MVPSLTSNNQEMSITTDIAQATADTIAKFTAGIADRVLDRVVALLAAK